MNNTKRILIVGVSALALLISLKLIGNRFSNPPEGSLIVPTNGITFTHNKIVLADAPRFYTDLKTNKDGAIYGKEVQTVRMDKEPERFTKMKQAMSETLESLGIEPKERVVQRLVTTRIKSDWSEVPSHFKTPDWAALESFKLKRAIARELNTTNELTFKRVLETQLIKYAMELPDGTLVNYPVELPPMADYKLRTGPEAVYDEAKAIEEGR